MDESLPLCSQPSWWIPPYL